jgi:rsbT co-antagonist protein RsbR
MDPNSDFAGDVSEQALMIEMGLTAQNIEHRKKYVGLGPDDLRRIASIKDLVQKRAEEFTSVFFASLSSLDEAKTLLTSRELLDRARRQELEHLIAMVGGEYGPKYVEQRVALARLYSRGLEPRVFLGAFHALFKAVGVAVMKQFERESLEGFETYTAFKKLVFFDIAITMDVLSFERERVIRQQQEAIRELSTPVLQIRDRLLLLPIIGVIDTLRARLITESLLRSIRANRAKVVVMDVTGVATIDSKIANHLLQTVSAALLMGATVIVTGLSSDVAQSLVSLGIDVAKFNTVGDLQGGLVEAEHLLGLRVVRETETARGLRTVDLDRELD